MKGARGRSGKPSREIPERRERAALIRAELFSLKPGLRARSTTVLRLVSLPRMRRLLFGGIVIAAVIGIGGCASRPLPRYERPLARTRIQSVRTTAYTHSEADHLQHGRTTALGTRLRASGIRSAAADWSRWPAGSIFRILETGEVYRVDDYGWALSGTNTIDLYQPSRAAMNAWGVRRVTIENLSDGDVDRSRAILRSRAKHRHVRRMLDELNDRYADLKRPMDPPAMLADATPRATPVEIGTVAPESDGRSSGPLLVPFQARSGNGR